MGLQIALMRAVVEANPNERLQRAEGHSWIDRGEGLQGIPELVRVHTYQWNSSTFSRAPSRNASPISRRGEPSISDLPFFKSLAKRS